jgi:hypothetical protein
MNIPRQIADLNSHVFLRVDQLVDQDASAIAAGFCQMQDKIIHLFSDLANIRPARQVDVLPFPCEQNPTLIHLAGHRRQIFWVRQIDLFPHFSI